MSTHPEDSGTRAARPVQGPGTGLAVAAGLLAFALTALAVPVARGGSPMRESEAVPIEQLKSIYLTCRRASADGRLDTGTIMRCSTVYEELKRRAFGGDFGKLLVWANEQRPARNAGR